MSACGSGGDPAIEEALLPSRLGPLPVELTDQVLAESHDITVPAGGVVFRDGDGPVVLLVVHGLLRTYLATSAGRELTIRYSRAGAIVGVGSLTTQPAGVRVQAVRHAADRGLPLAVRGGGHNVAGLGTCEVALRWI